MDRCIKQIFDVGTALPDIVDSIQDVNGFEVYSLLVVKLCI